jgi:hypothetical protein
MDDEDEDDRDYRPRRRTRGFSCPFCGSTGAPITKSRISSAGWVVFVVLLLFCFPLFWIGLLMKEQYRECYECGSRLGG